MDIRTTQPALATALKRSVLAVSDNDRMPALQAVEFRPGPDGLELWSSDGTVTMSTTMQAEVSRGHSVFAVHARSLSQIVDAMAGPDVVLIQKPNKVTVCCDGGKYTVPTIPRRGVKTPDVEFGPAVECESFVPHMRSVLHAMGSRAERPEMMGVYLRSTGEQITLVATDGLQLAYKTLPLHLGVWDVILPREFVTALVSLMSESRTVQFARDDRFWAKCGTSVVSTCPIDRDYVQYDDFISLTPTYHIVIADAELRAACDRACVVTSRTQYGVALDVDLHDITITATNPHIGDYREKIALMTSAVDVMTPTPPRIGINPSMLKAAIDAIDGPIRVGFTGEFDPVVVRPQDDESYTAVIMPMKIEHAAIDNAFG